MSTTITVLQKITSTALFLPFSVTRGGEGAPRMGTWQLGGKDLNIAQPAWPAPAASREHSLRDAPVHIRAPEAPARRRMKTIKSYIWSWLHKKISALMLTEMLRRKSYNYSPPTPNSESTSRDMQLILT